MIFSSSCPFPLIAVPIHNSEVLQFRSYAFKDGVGIKNNTYIRISDIIFCGLFYLAVYSCCQFIKRYRYAYWCVPAETPLSISIYKHLEYCDLH